VTAQVLVGSSLGAALGSVPVRVRPCLCPHFPPPTPGFFWFVLLLAANELFTVGLKMLQCQPPLVAASKNELVTVSFKGSALSASFLLADSHK